MEHLIHLTLKFVEEQYNLILSHSYKIESFKLKGSPERMWQRLKGGQLPPPHLSQNTEKGTWRAASAVFKGLTSTASPTLTSLTPLLKPNTSKKKKKKNQSRRAVFMCGAYLYFPLF